jgi:hypothetical protein
LTRKRIAPFCAAFNFTAADKNDFFNFNALIFEKTPPPERYLEIIGFLHKIQAVTQAHGERTGFLLYILMGTFRWVGDSTCCQ